MKNELLHIGPFTVYGYGLMIALGIVAAWFLASTRAGKRKMDQEFLFSLTVAALLGGFGGAKLLFWICQWKEILKDPAFLLWTLGGDGFVVFGGIIGGIGTAWLYCHKHKETFLPWLDLVMPSVALAQGFGRLGCLLAGCCYGKEVPAGAHGVVFPLEAVAPSGVELYPTQLMSAIGNFLIFAGLILIGYIAKKKGKTLKPYFITGLYLCLYGVGRFAVEFFRADPRKMLFGLSSNQYVSIVFLIIGLILIFRVQKGGESRGRDFRQDH